MSSINRRHFLQFAGSTLAAMGLSQVEFLTQADRYGKVLAQSTSRKLALLVGINAYSRQPLSGCLTDVALQRELLIHRYGFKSTDIVELRDQAATRRGIIDAFEQHLIQQAKPGDVVVFHYSGHGCKVADPDPNPGRIQKGEGFNGAIVPVDANASAPGTIRAIMGHTLFLLTAALQTENVTMV